MKRLPAILLLLFAAAVSNAQQSVNVLFIGNSYTEVNNLPQMTATIAQSMGDQLTYGSNTPGGCTFAQHCVNQSMSLIRQGDWDIVVLQEQSQLPSFPQQQVENEVFPYARQLVDAIYASNHCAEPMFYMTWGRKNGDQLNAAEFPPLGTYEGMDSLLCLRYTYMANSNDASLCPVGRVWNYLRHTSNIELYQSDESHPSLAGTYAAACAFYTMFFQRDPDSITYTPNGINANDAATIRNAVHNVVFEHLEQWKRRPPKAHFNIEAVVENNVVLMPMVTDADTAIWDFGDGTTQIITNNQCQTTTTHTYAESGTYSITLTARRHCITSIAADDVTITLPDPVVINSPSSSDFFSIEPNPITDRATIHSNSKGQLTIIASNGRPVQQIKLGDTTCTLGLSHLQSGMYVLLFRSENGVMRRKIVKR